MADVKLTSEEADALDVVLDPKNWETLHTGSGDKDVEKAAGVIDTLIKDQKVLGSKIVGYRKFIGLSNDPLMITEPGFLVLSDSKLSGDNVVEVTVLPGVQVLQLPGAYILGRSHKLLITPKSGGKGTGLEGLVEPGLLTASIQLYGPRIFLNSGALDPVQEFYNHAHGRGGKFTSGGGGGSRSGGSASGTTGSSGSKAKDIAKKAAIIAGVAVVVAGVVLLGIHAKNANSPEGQARLDKTQASRKAPNFKGAKDRVTLVEEAAGSKVRNAFTIAGKQKETLEEANATIRVTDELQGHLKAMEDGSNAAGESVGYLTKLNEWFHGNNDSRVEAMDRSPDIETKQSYHKAILEDAKIYKTGVDSQIPTLQAYSDTVTTRSKAMDESVNSLPRSIRVKMAKQFGDIASPVVKLHRETADKVLNEAVTTQKQLNLVLNPPKHINWDKVANVAIGISSLLGGDVTTAGFLTRARQAQAK